jgi:protein ImuB
VKRILSIWLPNLAIERWAKASGAAPDAEAALTVDGAHGLVIHAAPRAAAAKGAHPDGRLTDARALNPALAAIPADPAGDRDALAALARWAGRWSPLVEADGEDGLRLDVSGVAHLFGGEGRLLADVANRLDGLGLTSRAAIAPTAGAAWALARYGPSSAIVSRDAAAALAPLPVAALRLSPIATRTLERLGLKTIEALAGIERRSLARRFREADNPLDALDRALGRKPEPLTALKTDPPPRVSLRLEEPVTHSEAAPQALGLLVPRLVEELERRKLGARHLTLTAFQVDASLGIATVATAIPSREPKHLQRLLAEKAAAIDPGFGIDAFALTADWCEPLGAAQDSLAEEPNGERDVAKLVDRLTVKLGPQAVRRPCAVESHVPERASGWVAAINPPRDGEGNRRRRWRGVGALHAAPSTMLRMVPLPVPGRIHPQRQLDRPEAISVIYATPEGLPRRFVWRRLVHDIARVEGPERIAPEWWRQPSTARARDYYRVEDSAGRRYWIFREGRIGDGRGGAPLWFIHGLFG